MKLAILSDIHANLEALNRCLQYLDEEAEIGFTAVLGDIIGYGTDPVPCIKKMKERADVSIIGNHDAAVAGTADIGYFNMVARESIIWTRSQISEHERSYLVNLPYTATKDNIRFTHGTPRDPEKWHYIFDWNDTKDEFNGFSESICFVGHSHIPGIFEQSGTIPHADGPVQLDPGSKYIINVGSIGQPRDGDPRLAFAVLERDTWTLEIIRLEYDVETARQKIINSDLPPLLGNRLLLGR